MSKNERFAREDKDRIFTIIHRAIVNFQTVGKKTTISEDLLIEKVEAQIIGLLENYLNDDEGYERMKRQR